MTCIVGLIEKERIFLGGDSAGVSDWHLTVRADEKVFEKESPFGPILMGFTHSYRTAQVIRYSLSVPEWSGHGDLMAYMAGPFVDAVRAALKAAGCAQTKDGIEEGTCFLVGLDGRLFTVHSDYQVGENVAPFSAIGCGRELAIGAMDATAKLDLPGQKRVVMALEAAERWNAGVRGPFRVIAS